MLFTCLPFIVVYRSSASGQILINSNIPSYTFWSRFEGFESGKDCLPLHVSNSFVDCRFDNTTCLFSLKSRGSLTIDYPP